MASPIRASPLVHPRPLPRGAATSRAPLVERSRDSPSVRLDERAAALARGQPPLRRALAALAARLVATKGWERLGYARLGDYAVERLGVSARTVQDWAYVDRALAELPLLSGAMLRGELPWTSVRLLARVATVADEERWIERAKQLSSRALEREVRQVDLGSMGAGAAEPAGDDGSSELCEGIVLRCTPQARCKWNRVRQLANRVAGERMATWASAEAVAAEVASALPIDSHFSFDGDEPLEATRALGVRRRRQREQTLERSAAAVGGLASAFPSSSALCSLLEALEKADAFELDRRLRQAIRREQVLEAELGPLLHAIARRRRYRRWGYATLDHYARERLAMSPRRVRALLRIERIAGRSPELIGSYRAGSLSWVKVLALLPIARIAEAPHAEWVGWAKQVTVRRLQEDVESAVSAHDPQPSPALQPQPAAPPRDEDRDTTHLQPPVGIAPANRQMRAQPRRLEETARPFFSAPSSVARLFRAVLCSMRRHLEQRSGRLPSEGEAFEAMIDHALDIWGALELGTKRAHRVFARDGWRCTAPGCTSYRNLHDHHIRFRSAGGSDALTNRTTLCAWHHLRGVHSGIVRCDGEAPGKLRFELGVRAGKAPLAVYCSGDVSEFAESPNPREGVAVEG